MKIFIGILFLAVMLFALFTMYKYFKELFKKFKKKDNLSAADTVETEKETSEPVTTDSDVKKCAYYDNRSCNLVDDNGDCTIGKDSCEKDF